MRIRDILRTKDPDVVTLARTDSVDTLVRMLAEHNIGAAVVSTDGSTVEGIVSERDVVRSLSAGPDPLGTPVASIMTTSVWTCTVDDDVDGLMRLMTEHRIRHVPVVGEDGALAGIVSIGDVVKSKIGQLEFEKEQLEGYISSTG